MVVILLLPQYVTPMEPVANVLKTQIVMCYKMNFRHVIKIFVKLVYQIVIVQPTLLINGVPIRLSNVKVVQVDLMLVIFQLLLFANQTIYVGHVNQIMIARD